MGGDKVLWELIRELSIIIELDPNY